MENNLSAELEQLRDQCQKFSEAAKKNQRTTLKGGLLHQHAVSAEQHLDWFVDQLDEVLKAHKEEPPNKEWDNCIIKYGLISEDGEIPPLTEVARYGDPKTEMTILIKDLPDNLKKQAE